MDTAATWTESNLSPRVKRLREEYFSFYDRDYYRNEVAAFSTGKSWDEVYSPHNWTVVPEVHQFIPSFRDTLKAVATAVETPPGFFELTLAERRAIFFNLVLEKHLKAQILEGELIVGSHFNTALSKNFTRQEARQWRKAEDDFLKMVIMMHEDGVGNVGAIPGHLIPNYKGILEKGFKGISEKIQEFKKVPDNDPAYLNALEISTRAPGILASRYTQLAEDCLAREIDPERRQELQMIIGTCQVVPWEAPQNFHQAVQALWFTHMLVMAAESYPGAGLSYGRIDQYLYPFYAADIKAGVISRDFAKEILECFFIKHNYAYDYQGRCGANQGINSSFGQLITLSGCGPDGQDMTNDLTLLMLEIITDLNMLEPKPNVRLHANTPPHVLDKIVEIIYQAQGAPFLLNFDETSMKALECQGIDPKLLWDYAPVGCLENTMQGNDRSGTVDANLNLAKAVELTLNNGCDMASGKRIGLPTGNPEKFTSFDDFINAFKKQIDSMLGRMVELASQADRIRSAYEPTPYLSLLVDGCIEKGKDITAGGAVHNYITIEGVGLATTIDSLLAVRSLVYDKKAVSMERLIQGLKNDFKDDEILRQMLLNKAPKYGNNDMVSDLLGKEISDYWSRQTLNYISPATGRRFRAGYLSWNYWICYGPLTASTPDGRKRMEALSNGVGCVNGADLEGPTSAILSVGNIGFTYIPNGGSHTMSFNPSLLRDDEHREKFSGLLRTYIDKGGTALQINMIGPEILMDAQKNPDRYPNLLVRVTGYNAYFVNLGRAMQDEIIRREARAL